MFLRFLYFGTSETFFGESFRIQLLNNVTAFNGTAWDTTFAIGQLGTYDLQIKPGFLVDPGGSYGYWFTSDSLQESNEGYRYYIRRFQTECGTKKSMTVNLSREDDYEGGNMQCMDESGKSYFTPRKRGCMVLFDSRTQHRVLKVRKGVRKSIVGWVVGPRWK